MNTVDDMTTCPDCGTEYNPVDYWCCPSAQCRNYQPLIERCFKCGEVIEQGTAHLDGEGHTYHPMCCPDCDGEEPQSVIEMFHPHWCKCKMCDNSIDEEDEYEIICAACGLPITGRDYDERHWGHEEGCPRHDDPEDESTCDCDLEYHPNCAPDYDDDDTTNS